MALTQCKECNTPINYRGISNCPVCGSSIEAVEDKGGSYVFIVFNLLMLLLVVYNILNSYHGDNIGAAMMDGLIQISVIVFWMIVNLIVFLTRKK